MPLVLKYVPVRMLKVLQVAVNLLCGVCRPVAPSLVRSLFTEAAGEGLAVGWRSKGRRGEHGCNVIRWHLGVL